GSEAYAQFVDEDVRLLELIADRIALAINQATLHEAERAAQERLQFLAEATAVLASSLDVDDTLRRVARLAVPQLADWCAIELIGADGQPDRVASAGERSDGGAVFSVPLVVRDRTLGELTIARRRATDADRALAQE